MPRLYLISFDRTHMAVNNRIGARIAVQYDRFTYKGRPSHSVCGAATHGLGGTTHLVHLALVASSLRIGTFPAALLWARPGRQEVMLRAGIVFWSRIVLQVVFPTSHGIVATRDRKTADSWNNRYQSRIAPRESRVRHVYWTVL